MAMVRSLHELMGELVLLGGGAGPQSGRGDLLPVMLDATAGMPARAAGTTNLTPQQVLNALGNPADPWGASGALGCAYVLNGRGVGQGANPTLTTAGLPAGCLGAIFPNSGAAFNPNAVVPYFFVKTA